MTSNINPNNIDGAYPVAGQDNNSQGFRDNFTNTGTNFQFAANEITDLQSKAVLKAALTGTALDNDMGGTLLKNAQLQDMSETVAALGPVAGTVTINYALGSVQTLITNGSVSLAFSNLPAAGVAALFTVQVTVSNTAHTLTLPASVSVNSRGIQGYNPSTGVISFVSTSTYAFTFSTNTSGTAVSVVEVNKLIQPFNNSSEDLNNTATANLALTTSFFSTVAAETATLAAGVAGQIKVFAMNLASGNMVITVANAAWGTTITFTTAGQACTLQYVNDKWFCIGNNGATFA